MSKRQKQILIGFFGLTTLSIIALLAWLVALDQEIHLRLKNKDFLKPTQYFSAPYSLWQKQILNPEELAQKLSEQFNYRKRNPDQSLFPGDFWIGNRDECSKAYPDLVNYAFDNCIALISGAEGLPFFSNNRHFVVSFSHDHEITSLFQFEHRQLNEISKVELASQLLAQYVGEEPILQNHVSLGDIPAVCSNAVIAIEDNRFLEHQGVSPIGILRAAITNLFLGKISQGGSTITQQLIKNYFLTPERTIKRKFIEFFMALLLETRLSKDEILETYLNIIYLGQNGPFQVRGYDKAAQYYFQKKVSDLNLSECALMAAIINSPGTYNPFRNPDRAKSRRNLVLKKMTEHDLISEAELADAANFPLPTQREIQFSETAPYFLDAVIRQLNKLELTHREGLQVLTSLDREAQSQAQESVQKHLQNLEENSPRIKKLKTDKKIQLEGMLISLDLQQGTIQALVGGRSFRKTQFNRALDAKRQVGSIMKPIVYLTALAQENNPWNPESLVDDTRTIIRYDAKRWSPENYDKKYHGPVTMAFALKNSLNAATANLGMKIGLENIISMAKALGIESRIEAFPSLTLGAFELSPMEIINAYAAIARMGLQQDSSFILQVRQNEKILFEFQPTSAVVVDNMAAAQLIAMLKNTLTSGTAQAATRLGFTRPAAGKTGTTNDHRDAWFVGFTPQLLTLVWVGVDSNEVTGLTGGSGAVPIWAEYMKAQTKNHSAQDFTWPEGMTPLEE